MSNSKMYNISPSTTLHAITSGSPTNVPSLIFLHFWGGSSRTYSEIIKCLPSQHCITIDFRGWGDSTGPQRPDAYSIHDLASDIETLIPKLHIKNLILVGHSMGGKVAQLIAGRNVFGSQLKGMVLIAPAPPTPLQLPEDMREQQRAAYATYQSAEFVIRNVLTSKSLSDATVQMLVQDMLKGNKFSREAWPDYGMGEDIVRDAEKITVPVLMIGGEKDRIETVEKVRKEVMEVVNCEMIVVKGSGHLLPVEAPDEVAGLIERFLSRTMV
jgi:3-oxoadipate enol-lactonase